ncbi:N-6 DNA methylase [Paenibacillus sp. M-152]|uniref:class I SAM-dependent DNA methyltransferase n=1 Tax=Paenibacillus sp. M-152 TaxID=2487928 RepID=UPI000F6E689C|nr:N-6 DNA methylase [Paenibacillus sp. M-152]AZH31307.1 SAM-dependent methyltransferase [Paenibacillus sp. M-152]
MGNTEIVQKLWNLCNVLRDDGITYHQYVTELTYILFLKMMKETGQEDNIAENIVGLAELRKKLKVAEKNKDSKKDQLTNKEKAELAEKEEIAQYSWDKLAALSEAELKPYYNAMLRRFGDYCKGHIRDIYHDARSNIGEPKNLKKIISSMDKLDWFNVEKDGFGDLYEGLLEKNANEKKSGAGQYFTPRPLIDVMVSLVKPQVGEKCNDPACGTFGFMIAANKYVFDHVDKNTLSPEVYYFQRFHAFTGCELVSDTHRLALMNAMIHGIESDIICDDTLSNAGKAIKEIDVVLSNPPFGTKQGGERAKRDDFSYATSNKQLNFLQHIYRCLKKDGKARAAVVLPDNVLFADGDGAKIREDLMNKCNLHTILRLPTGIFYAQGVKTNVLFFNRGIIEKGNTQKIYFYDMRTNMPSFGKTTPLKVEHFDNFVKAYQAEDRDAVKDERWSSFTREEIAQKNNSLDLGLIRDGSVLDYEDLQDPIESGEEIIAQLEEAVDLIMSVVKELKSLGGEC